MKKEVLITVFFIGYLHTFSQEVSSFFIKSNIVEIECEKRRDSVFADFLDSMPDLRQRKGQFMPFSIYEFGTLYTNFISMNEGIIDTSLISKDYFLSGKYIIDFYDKTKSSDSTEAYISCRRSFIYDTVKQITYRFKVSGWTDRLYYDEWDKKAGRDTSRKPSKYLTHPHYPFEDYIGYLFYNNVIDFVFSFPTYFDYDEKLILSSTDTYFAIKEEKIYVIYENWTPENKGNNPQIIPIEEYLDCCWEEMTNVSKK